jgi:hypothetical protein
MIMPEIFVVDATVEVRVAVGADDKTQAEQKAKELLKNLLHNSAIGGGLSVKVISLKQFREL